MSVPLATIREALPSDAPGVARVHIDTWRMTYRDVVPDAYLDSLSYEQRTERWRSRLQNGSSHDTWVYVADHSPAGVVGFAAGGRERGGDPLYKGELYAIYVFKSFQHLGLGRQLTMAIVRRLLEAGLSSMLIWVLKDNPGARRFYERLGGVQVRTQVAEVGGVPLDEIGYGWDDLRHLIDQLSQTRQTRSQP